MTIDLEHTQGHGPREMARKKIEIVNMAEIALREMNEQQIYLAKAIEKLKKNNVKP